MFSHLRIFLTHRPSQAIGAAFLSMGFLFGSWATLIPFVKEKFALNDAELGLLLLSMPFGAMVFNPATTVIINKLGIQKTHLLGLFLLPICYMLPLAMPTVWLTSVGLVFTGMGISLLNIGMNTSATGLETAARITILSTCHGLFSLGLMGGSLAAGTAVALHVNPAIYMVVVGCLVIAIALLTSPIIRNLPLAFPKNNSKETTRFAWPTGALLVMICISLCTNVTEGAMADWTAVYMREIVAAPPLLIGWGLASYSGFMAFGRFVGDGLIPKLGSNRILYYGGLLAAFGLGLAILLPHTVTAIIGFACVGAGVSCGAPILYGSAARVPNMAHGAGLATMNTFSMAGFLVGPVLIGFISKAVTLPFALGLVGILAILWAFLAKRVKLY